MAEPAYELERFAPQPRRKIARVQVASPTENKRRQQFFKMARTLLGVMVLVMLVSAVLYTQATVTELQNQIAEQKQMLREEEALTAYLSFELDNKTSLKNLEESAGQMGLSRVESSQISYYRVDEATGIQVRENPFSRIINNTKNGFLSILEYITP